MRVIEHGIRHHQPAAVGHDPTDQLRRGVVQDHEVDLAFHRGLEVPDQTEAGLEAIRGQRIHVPIEEYAHIDVTLSVRTAVRLAAKKVGRDYTITLRQCGAQRVNRGLVPSHLG
jgi:hypothetical protein